MRKVLIVDGNSERRTQLAEECAARGGEVDACEDAFSAMNALGRGAVDVLVAHAGKRHLSLRGLLQLAKRKNHRVVLLVLADPDDEAAVRRAMGADVLVLLATRPTGEIASTALPDQPAPAPAPAPPVAPEPAPAPLESARTTDPVATTELVAPPDTDLSPSDDSDGVDELMAAPDTGASSPGADAFAPPPNAGAWEAGTGNHAITGEGAAVVEEETRTSERAGAAALMDAFARELTGALRVEGERGSWALFLYSGEVAWAHPPGGDAVVHERLVKAGALPTDAAPAPMADGELLGSLLADGVVDGALAGDVMREIAQEQALVVAGAEQLTFELLEKPAYLKSPPAFRINPFALLLEARKLTMTPDEVKAEADALRGVRVRALAGVSGIAGKIAPFVRGVNLSTLLDDEPTLAELRAGAGLDELLATLLVLALTDAGLVALVTPAPEVVALPSSVTARPLPEPANTGADAAGVIGAIEGAVLPNEILGVDISAEPEDVERAYEERVAVLAPDAVADDLTERAQKAREKLARAVRTMRATSI